MSLKIKIEEKLQTALKQKDKNTYPTLRLVLSAIKDVEIANRIKENQEITDSEIMMLLKKMIKQRNDSCEAYKKANREKLLAAEIKEIEIINSFLPKQLDENQTKKICEETIKLVSASSMKDMGKVMSELKKLYSDEIDFAKAGPLIKELLNS